MGDPYRIIDHLERKHKLYGLDSLSLDQLRSAHKYDHRNEYQDHEFHTPEEAGYAPESIEL